MALDVASLTLDDSQASLASMPEELWRKVTSYLRPATTARAFVVASGSVPRTVNGTGHTGPSEFCATSI